MTDPSTISQDLLTLEDVALLADGADSLPTSTKQRLRQLVLQDPRFSLHLEQLEGLAQEAGLGESQDRLGAALLVHGHYQQLEKAEGWEHPAEVLDPDGTIGVLHRELLHIARVRARGEKTGRSADILRKLDAAWAEEQRRDEFATGFVTRLLDFDPAEAELLLRRVGQELRWSLRQRQRAEEGTT